MKIDKWSVLGIACTAAGAVITIVQGIVGEKQQNETIRKEVKKVVAELKN